MLNHIILMGRLTHDPELRYTGANKIPVASFSIAVDRNRSVKDAEKETDFFDCVAWRATGEFISKYFRKGRTIVVFGRMESRKWNDKEGNKRTRWEVVVDEAYFGDSKKEDGAAVNAPVDSAPVYDQNDYAVPNFGSNGNYPPVESAPAAVPSWLNNGNPSYTHGGYPAAAASAPAVSTIPASTPPAAFTAPAVPAPAAPSYPDINQGYGGVYGDYDDPLDF